MEINEQVKTITSAVMGTVEEEATERKESDNKDSEKKRDKLRIALQEFSKFESTIASKLATTRKMAREVNSFFRPTINGYHGCKLRPRANNTEPNNPFELTIFIEYLKDEDLDKDKITVIKKVAVDKTTNAIEKINILNHYTSKHKMYALTNEGKEVLEDFIKHDPNKGIDWSSITSEVADTSISGPGVKYYMAINIDLIKMLKHIYGFKSPDGEYYEYNIVYHRPIPDLFTGQPNYNPYQQQPIMNYNINPMVTPFEDGNHLISIQRLDDGVLKAIALESGMVMPQQTTSGLGIVTDTNE